MISDVEALPADIDLAIIGAGPAGLAASAIAAQHGLGTLMLDENPGVGGQVYRAITANPVRDRAMLGADYWRGEALAKEAVASSAQHAAGAAVWSVSPLESAGYEIGVSMAGRSRMITAQEVMLATGALERPFPIPGWTLPGIMSCGGAQTALKASGLIPDGRIVIAGCGPLLWLIAWQYLNAGASIAAILDTTPRANWLGAMPHLPAFVASPYLAKGLKLMLAVRAKVRVITGVDTLRAEGTDKVESVVYTKGSREHRVAVDVLLLHQGVVPSINLSNAIGCRHTWDDLQLTWKPETDDWGMTSMPGLTVAGDGAGIAGAEAAAERGRIAALGATHRLGKIDAATRDRDAAAPRATLDRFERGRTFLDTLYQPAKAVSDPAGRHYRVSLRGSHRRPHPRNGTARRHRSQSDEVLYSLRHGAVPGQAVRPHGDRTDRRRTRNFATRGRLLQAAPAGETDHARRACGHAARPRRPRKPSCA